MSHTFKLIKKYNNAEKTYYHVKCKLCDYEKHVKTRFNKL